MHELLRYHAVAAAAVPAAGLAEASGPSPAEAGYGPRRRDGRHYNKRMDDVALATQFSAIFATGHFGHFGQFGHFWRFDQSDRNDRFDRCEFLGVWTITAR
jgi:hypothetical protein